MNFKVRNSIVASFSPLVKLNMWMTVTSFYVFALPFAQVPSKLCYHCFLQVLFLVHDCRDPTWSAGFVLFFFLVCLIPQLRMGLNIGLSMHVKLMTPSRGAWAGAGGSGGGREVSRRRTRKTGERRQRGLQPHPSRSR